MNHDLDKYLCEVASRLERFPAGVQIGWVDPSQLTGPDGASFAYWAVCAYPTARCPIYTIGVNTELRRAPRYVLRWLILHECLHVVIGPRKGLFHHRAFRQAERAHPDYACANQWLDAHASAATKTGRAKSKA